MKWSFLSNFRSKFSMLQVVSSSMLAMGVVTLGIVGCGGMGTQDVTGSTESIITGAYVVLGYNDLGMHCLNEDFSEICVLPPANTLRATVIRRGEEPHLVDSGVTVNYSVPGNTKSGNKTNFWKYAPALFGVNLPREMGLFGFGLSGNMVATPDHDYMAQGIPLTPVTDAGRTDAYQLSQINVVRNGGIVAATEAVRGICLVKVATLRWARVS